MRFPAGRVRDTHQALQRIGRGARLLLLTRPRVGDRSQLRWARSQRGQGLVLMTLAFVAILAFVGFAVDAGVLYVQRVRLGKAVDAAALAGAYELPHGAGACARVSEYLESHGYDAGHGKDFLFQLSYPDEVEFTIDSEHNQLEGPDDCANWSIPDGHYQVRVTGILNFPTNFLQLAGIETMPVVVGATAQMSQVEDVVFTINLTPMMYQDMCMVDNGSIELALDENPAPDYACYNAYDTSQCQVLYEYDFNDGETVDGSYPDGEGAWGPDWLSQNDMGDCQSWPSYVTEGPDRNGDPLGHSVILGYKQRQGGTGAANPRIVHVPGAGDTGFDPTGYEDLFVTYYVKNGGSCYGNASMEGDDDFISTQWYEERDGNPGMSTEDFYYNSGTFVQACNDCSGDTCSTCGSCYGPPGDAWSNPPNHQLNCSIDTLDFDNWYGIGGGWMPQRSGTTGWHYVVNQLPDDVFDLNDLRITINPWGELPGSDSEDRLMIDDLKIISCPMKDGPVYWYRPLPEFLGYGCWAPESSPDPGTGNWWNCEEQDTAQDTSLFPGTINMFPARKVMQQPLYDVMLAIAGEGYDVDGKPVNKGDGSFFNEVDPCAETPEPAGCISQRRGRMGFTTFKRDHSANDPTGFPEFGPSWDYSAFWTAMFDNGGRTHMNGPAYWAKVEDGFTAVDKNDTPGYQTGDYTGGIFASLQDLNDASPEADKPAIILITDHEMDYACSWHSGQPTLCLPFNCYSNWATCKAELTDQLDRAVGMGVKVFTIGMRAEDAADHAGREYFYAYQGGGSPCDPCLVDGEKWYYMDYIADYTGGEAYYVDSTAELKAALQEIADLAFVHLVK